MIHFPNAKVLVYDESLFKVVKYGQERDFHGENILRLALFRRDLISWFRVKHFSRGRRHNLFFLFFGYLDFCIFVKSTNLEICDVIINIAI